MAKWDSPNIIAVLMMVALPPPHFSIAVYSPAPIKFHYAGYVNM